MNFYGRIKDGKVQVYHRDRLEKFIKSLGECEAVFSVKKRQRMRSSEQNKLYWNLLTVIETETGQEKEDWHEHFKAQYLTDHAGKYPRIKSTTELTTIEFMEYITKLARDAAEFGINLPMPDDIF